MTSYGQACNDGGPVRTVECADDGITLAEPWPGAVQPEPRIA